MCSSWLGPFHQWSSVFKAFCNYPLGVPDAVSLCYSLVQWQVTLFAIFVFIFFREVSFEDFLWYAN